MSAAMRAAIGSHTGKPPRPEDDIKNRYAWIAAREAFLQKIADGNADRIDGYDRDGLGPSQDF